MERVILFDGFTLKMQDLRTVPKPQHPSQQSRNIIMCFDRSMEVELPVLENYDRPTNQQTHMRGSKGNYASKN